MKWDEDVVIRLQSRADEVSDGEVEALIEEIREACDRHGFHLLQRGPLDKMAQALFDERCYAARLLEQQA